MGVGGREGRVGKGWVGVAVCLSACSKTNKCQSVAAGRDAWRSERWRWLNWCLEMEDENKQRKCVNRDVAEVWRLEGRSGSGT